MAAVSTTTMKVLTPSQNLRRPEVSDRCPVIGARAAITRPAMARAQPSWAEITFSSPKEDPVRYTVKTKVVTTALNAAEPQSQNAQATTRPRVGVVPASTATVSVMSTIYCSVVKIRIRRAAASASIKLEPLTLNFQPEKLTGAKRLWNT